MSQHRCPQGQQLWAAYAKLDSKNIFTARKRAAALIVYQEHLDACQECAMGKAAEYQKAANAPLIPWDLEVTK
jgi:hypothetical protein